MNHELIYVPDKIMVSSHVLQEAFVSHMTSSKLLQSELEDAESDSE